MDNLDDDWDLPVSKNISRELFATYAENEAFDVDNFLLENNFHYVPLDTLSKDLTLLTQEVDRALLDASSQSYDDFVKLCDQFSDNAETRPELQNVRVDLRQFSSQLGNLSQVEMTNTKEIVADTVDYLKSLDKLSTLLQGTMALTTNLQLAGKLCDALDALCAEDDEHLEQTLCSDLVTHLHKITTEAHSSLLPLQHIDAPLILQLRSEYQGILSQFQACLHVLSNRCLTNPAAFEILAINLKSLIPKAGAQSTTNQ
ncbi:LADA_0B04984g1_1 [Lachancea dasiensis]|uniref:Conserved oligomeric Golgi complex subunit 2 n=1 Tax=Lachancea dasiensis TaxID=1072105 RepID=A0A1G4IT84_9SACH|nr:LADA_0B04984g1_1 [Lachancea dasiensis]